MSGRVNLLANLMPGPDEVAGGDGIPSPNDNEGGIPLPSDRNSSTDDHDELIRLEEEAIDNLRRARERRQAANRVGQQIVNCNH